MYSFDWYMLFSENSEYTSMEAEILFKILYSYNISDKVLDLACGSGRLTRELRARGVDISGLDNSKTALELARQADPQGNYILCDIRDIRQLNLQYNAILSIWASFGMLSLTEDREAILNIYSILNKGGLFIMDVYNKEYFELQEPVMHNTFTKLGKEIKETKSYYDGVLEVNLDFGDHQDVYKWNLYTPTELGEFLEKTGFQAELYSWWRKEKPTNSDIRFQIIGVKV